MAFLVIVYFSGQARGPVRTGGLRAGCVKKSSFFKKISKNISFKFVLIASGF